MSGLPDWYHAVEVTGLPMTLGIEILELTPKRVVATMPVDQRTRQPFGILHGGASVALAETVASFGAVALIDRERFVAVGQEINAEPPAPEAGRRGDRHRRARARRPQQPGVVDRDPRRGGKARLHLALHDGRRREEGLTR